LIVTQYSGIVNCHYLEVLTFSTRNRVPGFGSSLRFDLRLRSRYISVAFLFRRFFGVENRFLVNATEVTRQLVDGKTAIETNVAFVRRYFATFLKDQTKETVKLESRLKLAGLKLHIALVNSKKYKNEFCNF